MDYQEKYELLHRQVYGYPADYQKLYQKVYQDGYDQLLRFIQHIQEPSISHFHGHLTRLEIKEEDLHKILIKCMELKRNEYIQELLTHYVINCNYKTIVTHESLIALSMKYDSKIVFDYLVDSEKVHYEECVMTVYESNGPRTLNLITQAILYNEITKNHYYFERLSKIEVLQPCLYSQGSGELFYALLKIKESSEKLYFLRFFNYIYTESNESIVYLFYLNYEDDLYEMIGEYSEKLQALDLDKIQACIMISTLDSNFRTIQKLFSLLPRETQEELWYHDSFDLATSIKRRVRQIKESNPSLHQELTSWIRNMEHREESIECEVRCTQKHTCNICLDEESENQVYKKCNHCQALFHKSCLEEYFCASDKWNQCCYCQNRSKFSYVKE